MRNSTMPTITFKAVEVNSAYRDRDELRKWLCSVARYHGHSIGELTFVLMTDKALLEYNKRYLGHDEYTDVITFDGQTGTGISGDILMSYERIKENADSFGVSIQHELRRVMVHGLLHLLGHEDKTKAQRSAMREMEDVWLKKLA
ncbi:MAG: rRNA maturation RNase YbeY [Flavobacteriales bacterium]|nr:rRNA maturation RNase YbeY [Flavobacteriales bacterium]